MQLRRTKVTRTGSTRAWRELRERVLIRDQFECQLKLDGCQRWADQVDHVVPLALGGQEFDEDNLVAACRSCNQAKGLLPVDVARQVADSSVSADTELSVSDRRQRTREHRRTIAVFLAAAVCAAIALIVDSPYMLVAVVCALVLRQPQARAWLRYRWRLHRHRQRWEKRLRAAGLAWAPTYERHQVHEGDDALVTFLRGLGRGRKTKPGRKAPKVLAVTERGTTTTLRVRLTAQTTAADLQQHQRELAVAYAARHVAIDQDRERADRATVTIALGADPLGDPEPLEWPGRAPGTTLHEPVPFAVDEHGQPVTVQLVGKHVLLAGSTGAGKSRALALLVAAVAQDPRATMVTLDYKRVELSRWKDLASVTVRDSIDDALAALDYADQWMQERYSMLEEREEDKSASVTRSWSW